MTEGPGLGGAGAAVAGIGVPIDPDIAIISVDLISKSCAGTPKETLAPFVEPIRRACIHFEINSIRRVAAFIAQMGTESQSFTRFSENLNYRAERLMEVWPRRFQTMAVAAPYAHNPEKLANRVYADRMGNGDEASGDGWRYRGEGPLQITGKSNWLAFAAAMGMTLEQALAYGQTVEGGVMAAAWFWEANGINRLADTPGVSDESRRINGGDTGLADRTARFNVLVNEMLRLEGAK